MLLNPGYKQRSLVIGQTRVSAVLIEQVSHISGVWHTCPEYYTVQTG